jgi:hypothetical protein
LLFEKTIVLKIKNSTFQNHFYFLSAEFLLPKTFFGGVLRRRVPSEEPPDISFQEAYIMAVTFPRTDDGLLAWSLNFKTLITATPITYGLTAAQATAYGTVHTNYATALQACDPAVRNKTSTMAKNDARTALKTAAQQTASIVEGTPTVTDSQKISLGLNVRRPPSPVPAPSSSPGLDVVSTSGWMVQIRLHDTTSTKKRGKPPGVSGASVFSYVGATPPTDIGAWKFEGNTGKTTVDVTFPITLPMGTKVWLTAFWFNGRKESGPACLPVSATIYGGTVSVAA